MDHHHGDGTPYALQPRCAVCRSASGLLHCGGCKVSSYCGRDHQSAHRSKHKAACNAIQKTQQTLEREEAALRANTDDFVNPGDAFLTGVGHFWGILHTRDYMRARFAAADALLKVNTKRAVEKALDHFTDMLRLCRSDNLGVRDFIPGLLLRLGREQECYDFIKWFSTVDGHYDWGDNTLPYLDIRDADVCEPVDKLRSGASLSHLVMLTLLKLSLRLDLDAYETASGDPDRPLGTLARSKLRTFGMRRIAATIETLTDQYNTLCQAVHDANPYVWDVLVDQGAGDPTMPPTYTMGSLEEAHVVLYQCKRAWEESEDAILMIESDTCSLVPVYQSPAATIAGGGDASSITPDPRPAKLARMRGVGKAFPSMFNTTLPAPSPIELFPATRTGGGGRVRFVSRNDARAVLVYADGACLNNGQPDPRAGWAVMCSQTDGASGRLENRGPFGDYGVATSNRAELRAAIAALRLCDWTAEGFNNIVIATDSSYVVEGATGWAKGWVRNGWKTRTGGDVKNRDLWELLLGEVERWEARGFRVALWRIPRALNADADHRAKEAAEGGPEAEFRDAVIRDSQTTTTNITDAGAQPNRRILALCLEYEGLFDDVYGTLGSAISSKITMERATTPSTALSMLSQEPPPAVILVADGAITRNKEVCERLIDRLRGGSTVVLSGCFSSTVTMGEFDRLFARIGLPWRRGSYDRKTTRLRRHAVSDHLASRLPSAYSQKALFVKNVDRAAAWYTEKETSDEAAVVFAEVGAGKLGYVGDVNGEEGSAAVVMAMCGLLD